MNKKNTMSPSMEDYLETLYFLTCKNEVVRVTDMATDMNISKPSVNKAINALKAQNLVEHEHYGALSLTEEGKKLAKSIADRHVVLKKFLHELLEIDEKTAEEEACLIEHSMSQATVDKLSLFLKTIELQKK